MKWIRRFRADSETAKFWDTRSFADLTEDTASAKIRFIRTTKNSSTIRLDPDDIAQVGEIAKKARA